MVHSIVLEKDNVSVFQAFSRFRILETAVTIACGTPDNPFKVAQRSFMAGAPTLVSTATSATEPSVTAMVVLKVKSVSVVDGGSNDVTRIYDFTSEWFERGDNAYGCGGCAGSFFIWSVDHRLLDLSLRKAF